MDSELYTARTILNKSGNLFLVESIPEDIPHIANNLRKEDEHECKLYDFAPNDAIFDSFIESEGRVFTLLDYEKPIAIMGVTPVNVDIGKVWFLATDDLYKHYRTFLRKCPDVIDLLQGNYKVIFNFVPQDNLKTIRWLSWCGFYFDVNKTYLHNKHTFLQFFRCNIDKSMSYNKMSQPIYH